MNRTGFALVLLLISVSARTMAQTPVEVWECKNQYAMNWGKILVTATVDSGRRSGTILVAGTTYRASFEVAGFNRRWDFGPPVHPSRYAFIIDPDGNARYYSFEQARSGVKPSLFMECRQTKGA